MEKISHVSSSYRIFMFIICQVKVPLYGCDCYAYALLASGFVDLVVESGLKVYAYLFLVPKSMFFMDLS